MFTFEWTAPTDNTSKTRIATVFISKRNWQAWYHLNYAGGLGALLLVFLGPVLPCAPLGAFFFAAGIFVGTTSSSSGCVDVGTCFGGGKAWGRSASLCPTTGVDEEDAPWSAGLIDDGSWRIEVAERDSPLAARFVVMDLRRSSMSSQSCCNGALDSEFADAEAKEDNTGKTLVLYQDRRASRYTVGIFMIKSL